MDPCQAPPCHNTASDEINATTFYPTNPFICNSSTNTSSYQNTQGQPSQSYSLPLINVSTTNTSPSNSPTLPPCSICGDRAGQHLHYGAVACFSCRQFFRRGKTRGKQCIHGTGDCVINKHNRTNCKPCRLY